MQRQTETKPDAHNSRVHTHNASMYEMWDESKKPEWTDCFFRCELKSFCLQAACSRVHVLLGSNCPVLAGTSCMSIHFVCSEQDAPCAVFWPYFYVTLYWSKIRSCDTASESILKRCHISSRCYVDDIQIYGPWKQNSNDSLKPLFLTSCKTSKVGCV